MHKDITGAILAGGKSTRMGEDKAFMTVRGMTIIEFLYREMTSVFERVIIISNEPEKFLFLNAEVFPDIYSGIGPLAGIHSALVQASTETVFVIPCDAPLLTPQIFEQIINVNSEKPITYCHGGGFTQHLIGMFSKRLLPDMENILGSDTVQANGAAVTNCSIGEFINNHEHEVIEFPLSDYPTEFLNLNSKKDFEQLQLLLSL